MTSTPTTNEPKYPHITVQLTGEDGNAFAIMGATRRAMRAGGLSAEEADAYTEEAMSGDYDNLLATTMRWITVT